MSEKEEPDSPKVDGRKHNGRHLLKANRTAASNGRQKPSSRKKPTPGQRISAMEATIESFLNMRERFNSATQAYEMLHPGVSHTSAKAASSRFLARPEVQARIQERIAEAGINRDEVVGFFVGQMRGDIADILPDNPVIKAAKANGTSHLIKKCITKKYWDKVKEAEVEETVVELYSSQLAAKQLCSIFGLEKMPGRNPADEQFMREELQRSIARIIASDGVDEATAKLQVAQQLKDDPQWAPYVNELVN